MAKKKNKKPGKQVSQKQDENPKSDAPSTDKPTEAKAEAKSKAVAPAAQAPRLLGARAATGKGKAPWKKAGSYKGTTKPKAKLDKAKS